MIIFRGQEKGLCASPTLPTLEELLREHHGDPSARYELNEAAGALEETPAEKTKRYMMILLTIELLIVF